MTDQVFVQLIDMPTTVKETVTPNSDGSYTVFINAKLTKDAQAKAYRHALFHIEKQHFLTENPATELESDTHKEVI